MGFQDLREIAWRRRLSPAEQSRASRHFAARPQALAGWNQEIALTRCLNQLPSAPVSSNFTALVMQAALRAPVQRRWYESLFWFPSGWLPRAAIAVAMACLSFVSMSEYQVVARQTAARELVKVNRLASMAPVEWLKDFQTINNLNRVKVADDDLLAVLQ
ncbi:MAG: hypothetical protein ACRD5L_11225 [Bryobacteraceae bacterium]